MERNGMQVDLVLWDRGGNVVFGIVNDWLVNAQGELVGFIERDGAVYSIKGRHGGWFSGGILRDLQGHCLAMTDRVDDPIHPLQPDNRQQPPALPYKRYPLMHPPAPLPWPRPLPRYTWSSATPRELFA
jgi:hypothetical protein